METSGERLSVHLQKAIISTPVNKVSVFRFHDNKLFNESYEFSFGNEFMYVGSQHYNLNRLVTYKIGDGKLWLYF
ncbi:hypothetical protein [Dyadobacter sp. NIV53]|uniref:hypothetical protein n=1 Tax=Dyadobacter sp. NIV53 TaxID=2861765 RepID=UPI001C8785F1|nr:hypothetical protein [Dyadobacter sp. NIV53]